MPTNHTTSHGIPSEAMHELTHGPMCPDCGYMDPCPAHRPAEMRDEYAVQAMNRRPSRGSARRWVTLGVPFRTREGAAEFLAKRKAEFGRYNDYRVVTRRVSTWTEVS